MNLLSNRRHNSLSLRTQTCALVPAHPLQHLEAQVVLGQLVGRVVGLVKLFPALQSLELKNVKKKVLQIQFPV